MGKNVKDFLDWCRRHLLLVTIVTIVLIISMTYVNLQVLHMTSEPEFCHLCHPAKGFGALAEVDSWEHSGHAEAGVSCLDCHGQPGFLGYLEAKMGGLKDLYFQMTITPEEKRRILENPDVDLVPSIQCKFCHTDEGNRQYREEHKYTMQVVEMRMLDSVENPEFRERKGLPDIMEETFVGGTHFDHAFHMESFEMECNNCHFGLIHRLQSKTDRMNMCLVCHSENQDSSAPQLQDCIVCHEAQLAMNEGKGAKGIAGEASLMYGAGIDCQGCHSGAETGSFRPTAEACLDCHEEAYVDIYNDWSSETKLEFEKLKRLRAHVETELKEADKRQRNTTDAWALYQKALYNMRLVKNDGTFGVHNREYAAAILESVKADFNEVLKSLEQTW